MIVPDTIDPVVGWKGLIVWEDELKLISAFGHQPDPSWPHQERHTARCHSKHEEEGGLPIGDCSCGFYIAKNYHSAMTYTHPGGALVEVYGWGKVVQHELGWRTQYAYPKRIVLMSGEGVIGDYDEDFNITLTRKNWHYTDEFAAKLSEKYGVPVTIENYNEYPDKFSPRKYLLRALRMFLITYGVLQFLFFLLGANYAIYTVTACALLLPIIMLIPTTKKAPHERNQE